MAERTSKDRRHVRSESTRRQLLEAAARVFGERSYADTTLALIATAADVHRALVRYHFGSKQGLYSAVLREAIGVGRELLAPVRDLKGPAADRLESYIDALGQLFKKRPYFAPTIVREWMSGGEHVEPDVMSEFMHFFQVDREILELGVQEGEFRSIDPQATHVALVGSLVFFEITRPLRENRAGQAPPIPTTLYRDHVKELLRRGLTP